MGVYLSYPKTTKSTKSYTLNGIKYTTTEMQGWRKNMEDARITLLSVPGPNNKSYAIFGVFDGHGGAEVSKFVEENFVEYFTKCYEFKQGNIYGALYQTFCAMDDKMRTEAGIAKLNEIRKSQQGEGQMDSKISYNAGCTANVLVFDDQNYYIANAGDSRCALSRDGKLVTLSEDHKPECPIEERRIEKAGGVIFQGRVNGGLNLTRAIGDFYYKNNKSLNYKEQVITCHPDVKKVPRHPDDYFIIMGCDGICQLMINDLKERKKGEKNSNKLIYDLLDSLLAKSTVEELGCDNMTAILIEFKQ